MKEDKAEPLSVTIFSTSVLFIITWQILRVYSAFAFWQTLNEFGANSLYLGASGLFWSLAGTWFYWAVETRQRRAIPALWARGWLYASWYWLDKLLIQADPAPNIGFSLGATALLLLYFILGMVILNHLFPQQKENT